MSLKITLVQKQDTRSTERAGLWGQVTSIGQTLEVTSIGQILEAHRENARGSHTCNPTLGKLRQEDCQQV